MDQDVRCPNCGTTKYANVNLRIMVNVCGHGLCESCVDLLFAKGAGKCPTCGVILKRHSFRVQLYDDENVEKDLEQRRRLLKELNLKEEDFGSLREYNDYLELFETFVYNLSNDIDVAETNRRIDEFKREHSTKLTKKRNKVSKDLEEIERQLEEEKEAKNNRNLGAPSENFLAARKIAARKENLLDDLMTSDLPAEMIVKSFQRKAEQEIADFNESEAKLQQQLAAALAAKRQQKLTFSSGIRIGSGPGTFDHEMADAEAVPFVYKVPKLPNDGPTCPTPRTIMKKHYLTHTRQPNQADLAGGFSALYPCQRALQEAIIDLTFLMN